MSVQKDPSGRRRVQVEVEVPGTPEQVWQAIASGPGISAWFVPTQIEGKVGGKLSLDFGGGMVSSAEITEWQPPRRFVAEDKTWLAGGPPVATEWSVEAKAGGTCIVRVVHSLFASTDDWDGQLEGTEHGWPGYFRVLRFYLEHHAGEPSTSFVGMAPSAQSAAATWRRLLDAFGVDELRVGQRLRLAPAGLRALSGTVQAIDHVPQGIGCMLHVEAPAPGIVLASAMDCMGMQMATLQAYYYGAGAAAAVADQDGWRQWLAGLFPMPAEGGASG
ncbi:MAG: SRPBCC domain-containing protein [Planctomycetes bacterium]|nr:SRPBCC domain-containing protein [Planctomycetota bacterium]